MRYIYLALLLILPVSASAAHAGLVTPSSTVQLNALDAVLPGGALVDQMSSSFSIDYGLGQNGMLRGSLNSSVYSVGGKLTFVYGIEFDSANAGSAAEASKLSVTSFSKFSTNITGSLGNEINIPAGRSADGNTLWIQSGSPGAGGAPMLIVATDATSYNRNGMANFMAGDELLGLSGELENVQGQADFASFQPGAAPTPSAIPLPPAFYTGMGVLAAMALLAATKRFWASALAR